MEFDANLMPPALGVLGLLIVMVIYQWIKKQPGGSGKVQKIGEQIHIGSIFYGNVLGIFLLAFFVKFVKSNSTFIAAIITQIIVIIGWWFDWMPYLWLNMFGCALVMSIAILIEFSVNQKLETSRE